MIRAALATTDRLFDLVFPWSCAGCGHVGEWLCESCRQRVWWLSDDVCGSCGLPDGCPGAHPRAGPDAIRSVAAYGAAGPLRSPIAEAIHRLKYRGRRGLWQPLSRLLADRFPFDPRSIDCILPVPLHHSRLRERGYNQAALLAREPARRFGLTLALDVLTRVRPTPPQVGLPQRARAANLRGAFRVTEPSRVVDRHVLLVDDVATSTATITACAEVLQRAGARRIDALTVARVLPDA